jgi:Zn-dependent protease/CBS domain-containing protein
MSSPDQPTPNPATSSPQPDARMSGTVGLVRVFGVPVRLHFTFVLLILFLFFLGATGKQSSLMMVFYILALFGSVILHELGHSLVAKRYGVKTIEIVMFPIGGLARLDRAPKPKEEFWIAIAGPAVNFLIAGGIIGYLYVRGGGITALEGLREATDLNLLERIALGNLLLALFNLLPAYPMDGGRVLRSLLAFFRPENEATRLAAGAGKILAFFMGLFGLLSMNFFLIFIAFFVYLGASQESAMAMGKSLTEGLPVRAAMVTEFRTLSHGDTIRDAVNLLLSTTQQDFPVVLGGQVLGLLGRNALLRAMAVEGPDSYVASAMNRNFARVSPEADLAEALPLMAQAGNCVFVMDGDELVGLLTSENISEFLLLRRVGLTPTEALART